MQHNHHFPPAPGPLAAHRPGPPPLCARPPPPPTQGWHPGSFRNTEKVWKKEQEAAAEDRKLEELRKQLEDEKKANEYVELAAAAGHRRWVAGVCS